MYLFINFLLGIEQRDVVIFGGMVCPLVYGVKFGL